MPKQLHLSVIVDLPDDVFAAARATDTLATPWEQLVAQLKNAGIKHVHTCETLETRAKVERKARAAEQRSRCLRCQRWSWESDQRA